jgi:hypothetical protein
MSTDDDNKFLDELRAARPAFQPYAEEWASGDCAREVLERVLAVAETAAVGRAEPVKTRGASRRAGHAGARWWTGPRLLIAGGVLALVVVAVSLAVVFAGGTADHGPIAAGQVSKLTAVEDLMPLYRLKEGQTFDSLTHPTSDSRSSLDQAVGLGLLTQAEVKDGSATKPITQGEYAVLLAKAFGSLLPERTYPTLAIDAGATAGERAAIGALATSGIILQADGPFSVSQTLTKEVESRLLDRIQESLKHSDEG